MEKRARRKYTAEYKAEVVKLVLDGGKKVGEVSHDLDLTESAVRQWVKPRAPLLPASPSRETGVRSHKSETGARSHKRKRAAISLAMGRGRGSFQPGIDAEVSRPRGSWREGTGSRSSPRLEHPGAIRLASQVFLLRDLTPRATTPLDLGFQEFSAFTHSFRRWTGVSPRAYRQATRAHAG